MRNRTIGTVAREIGIRIDTIRFYERQGLIEPPPRTESGYRVYGTETVRRLAFIQQAKELGFSLREIKELLVLETSPGMSCADVRERALQKLEAIERKIKELEKIRKALLILSESCPGKGPVRQCTILDALRQNAVH
jgi:MerR family mercuric resistance operon transcriptional regulator